ncbi:MAG TPA: PepSY domain-containing protein [Acetobacteraceae bacterium]
MAALTGLTLASVAGTASAAGQGGIDPEAAAVASIKVSLTQAIATAEQQTGGKAYDAGVDADHGKNRIVVETNGPKGVQTVIIDANTGKVIGQHQGGVQD